MASNIESRLDRLERELAHASNNAFDVNSVQIAVMIVVRALAGRLPPDARQKALADALADAARQREQAMAQLRFIGADRKATADYTSLQEAVVSNIQRMLDGDGS